MAKSTSDSKADQKKRRCTGPCGRDLPLNEFHRDRTRASGIKARCKRCKNEEHVKERQRWTAIHEIERDQDLLDEIQASPDIGNFGTPIERASVESFLKHGGIADAAVELQLTPAQLRAHLSELKRRATSRGYAPGNDMTKPSPEGFSVKGVSTLYDAEGNVKGQWVKTKADEQDRIAMLLDAMSGIADAWKGRAEPIDVPEHTDDDLLCVYMIGDAHLGLYAWPEEAGDAFDLDIAESHLTTAIDHLVDITPKAKQALLVSVGDYFHADSDAGTTTAGTRVDVDTRWAKVLRVGIRTMRRCIERTLEKHEKVRVICERGNHDSHTSMMLAICLSQFYERDPRVEIDTNPGKFHYYRFGENLIGVTHSDTVKLDRLPGVMACDRAEDWGQTKHRRWICGHVHHDQVKEFPGVTVETIRTLAPKDAWHSASGYRSGQDLKVDVIHRRFGQVNRHVIGIQQIKSMLVAI